MNTIIKQLLDNSKNFMSNPPNCQRAHSYIITWTQYTQHESELCFKTLICFKLADLYLQTGLLWEQVSASTNSSYFYRRHRAADVEVFVGGTSSLHQSDAIRAAHVLCSVLQIKKKQNKIKTLN